MERGVGSGKSKFLPFLHPLGRVDENLNDRSVGSSSPVPQSETDRHSSISGLNGVRKKRNEASAGTRAWCKET